MQMNIGHTKSMKTHSIICSAKHNHRLKVNTGSGSKISSIKEQKYIPLDKCSGSHRNVCSPEEMELSINVSILFPNTSVITNETKKILPCKSFRPLKSLLH